VRIDRVQMMAVPATGSGTLARFPMSPVVVVELAVRDALGAWVPPGTRAQLGADKQSAVVGYEGRVYLQNPPAGAQLSLELPSGRCQVQLPQHLPDRGRVDVGVVSCQ
ncbi:FimD/PapC C-terminal domain-containing protein, partial [Comamonas jiangduensis]|uniref:FimD/PapC C-terminal domain-containing protein n=1 Tax=Comamonas jiangduensis TaxID=1194168 RepID=UPI003BF7B862